MFWLSDELLARGFAIRPLMMQWTATTTGIAHYVFGLNLLPQIKGSDNGKVIGAQSGARSHNCAADPLSDQYVI